MDLSAIIQDAMNDYAGGASGPGDTVADFIAKRVTAALGAEAASPTGDSDKAPGTPPDTSWNKRASPPGGEWVLVPRDDPARSYSDSLLPDEMVRAGMAALEQAEHDLANYVSGETTDWDAGMMCVAIYRAMLSAAPPHQAGGEWQGIDTAPRDGTVADLVAAIRSGAILTATSSWRDDIYASAAEGNIAEKLVKSALCEQIGRMLVESVTPGWLRSEQKDGRQHWSLSVFVCAPRVIEAALPAPPREAVGVGTEGASRTESTDARCDATAEDTHNHSEGED